MLAKLLSDHDHIRTVLEVLHRHAEAIQQDPNTDLSILRSIFDYLQNQVEQSHHLIEEQIYAYCLDLEIENNGIFAALASEHQQLEDSSEALVNIIDGIITNDDKPNENLDKLLTDYIELQHQHMSKEEELVAPLLKQKLNDEDWHQINTQLEIDIQPDPLFATQVADKYLDLAKQLKL